MNKLLIEDVVEYVEKNIGVFHEKRLSSLNGLSLQKILKRKNPYLFKAKNVLTAEQIIRGIVDAHISSNEETVFGDWLEGLAIFINEKVYSGKKSGINGIDLEFDHDSIRYIVAIKSGPNWGNSSQVAKMKSDFSTAIKTLRTSNSKMHIIAVNGCCYGRDINPDKGTYFKYCGQSFWEFISGNENLFIDVIEPLGTNAKAKNELFIEAYSEIINKLTYQLAKDFCTESGALNWKKIVEFNSSK